MKIIRTLCSRALPVLFWILLMLAFDTPAITAATLLAALIHELGHIAVGYVISGGSISLPSTVLFGLRIRPQRMLSYKEEAVLALGGPLINILVFLILIPFFDFCDGYFSTFAFLNLLTAFSNLVPIKSYDGYRILSSLLSQRLGAEPSEKIMNYVSSLFTAFAVFLSLFFMYNLGEGYWIFAVFFSILISDILKSQKRTFSENN